MLIIGLIIKRKAAVAQNRKCRWQAPWEGGKTTKCLGWWSRAERARNLEYCLREAPKICTHSRAPCLRVPTGRNTQLTQIRSRRIKPLQSELKNLFKSRSLTFLNKQMLNCGATPSSWSYITYSIERFFFIIVKFLSCWLITSLEQQKLLYINWILWYTLLMMDFEKKINLE